MSLLRAGDFFYALRFLRLLTTPWKKTTAFEVGIVDDKGKVIKKPETSEEKNAYGLFHKLVFNLKRLLNKIPLGKSTIASYAAALYLIKEETGISDRKLGKILEEVSGFNPHKCEVERLNEWYLDELGNVQEGKYALGRDIALPKTGEILAKQDTWITISESAPVGHIFDLPVFQAYHHKTKQTIYITQEDIIR